MTDPRSAPPHSNEPTKAQFSLRDKIWAEREKGNIVFQAMPGEFLTANLEAFLEQPADGILYDLNRGEEVAISFIHEPKWVNDFAAAMTIRKLVEQRNKLREEIATRSETAEAYPGIAHDFEKMRSLLVRIANANVIFPSMCANNSDAYSINEALKEYKTNIRGER